MEKSLFQDLAREFRSAWTDLIAIKETLSAENYNLIIDQLCVLFPTEVIDFVIDTSIQKELALKTENVPNND